MSLVSFSFQNNVTVSDLDSNCSTGSQPLSDTDNAGVQQPLPAAVTSCTPSSVDTPHECQQGSPAFVQLSSLKSHMASPHRQKQLAESPRGDSDVGNLGDRSHEVNTDKGSQHVCDDNYVCSTAFTGVSSLNGDEGIHTSHKLHGCDVYSKAFSLLSDLEEHKRIHTGHRSIVCDVCGKNVDNPSNLRKHKMIHTGHKPFACDVCGKAFTEAYRLKRHKIIHSGHKPFLCDVCSKTFTYGSNFRRHKKTHTGHKSFACDVCSKAYTDPSTLKRHKMIHTGDKPFVCDVCN